MDSPESAPVNAVEQPSVTDPLRTYADAYHYAVECYRRVEVIQSIVSRAAEALDKRPERFRFDKVDSVRMPRTLGDAFAPAGAWPTAEQIQQVMAEWHIAGDRLMEAWEALWPRDRELLSRSSPESANIPKLTLSEAARRVRQLPLTA